MKKICLPLGLLAASLLNAQDPYTILYTGRLLGYPRTPDSQLLNAPPAAQRARPNSVVAQDFAGLFSAATPTTGLVLRLGMGDNFAPSLFARSFEMGPNTPCPVTTPRRPKDRFFYDSAASQWKCTESPAPPGMAGGNTSIDFDNVAEFFIGQKYHALVPGKHDFYFGAERLRAIARYLYASPAKTRMLGANLIISTSRPAGAMNAYPRIPAKYSTVAYQTFGKVFTDGDVSVTIPDSVLPWNRRFTVSAGAKLQNTNPDAWLCPEPGAVTAGHPDGIPAAPSANIGCTQLTSQTPPAPAGTKRKEIVYELAPGKPLLTAGLNYGFYLADPDSKTKPVWAVQPFSVQTPLFDWGHGAILPPWQLVTDPASGTSVAVFGVVAPDLLGLVGLLNSAWENDNKTLDTITTVIDPEAALRQSLDYCDQVPACKTAPKVLMAQLIPARATQLFSRFHARFQAVVTEADSTQYTGDGTDQHRSTNPRFVLVPPDPVFLKPDHFQKKPDDPDRGLTASVARAEISAVPAVTGHTWTARNSLYKATEWRHDVDHPDGTLITPVPHTKTSTKPSVACAAEAFLPHARSKTAGCTGPDDPVDTVQKAALLALRKYAHADVAMLQKRDFYDPEWLSARELDPADYQNQVDRIFWKGDFAITLHVTGSTLRAILAQSDQFDTLDKTATEIDRESGRSVVTLGISKDSDGDPSALYVNGARVDDAALYTIATSEFLALGDTGYSMLATPDVPPATRVESFKRLRGLSGIVCSALFPAGPCDQQSLQVTRDPNGKTYNDYFDRSNHKPFDATPGFDAAAHYRTFLKRLALPDLPTAEAEGTVQQRPFWTLKLEKADINYSGTYVNHRTDAANNFSSISTSSVTTTSTDTLGFDWSLRLIRDFKPGTFYLLTDASLSRAGKADTPLTLTSNVKGFEGGGTLRLLSFLRRPDWLSLQYSGRFEGQFKDPPPNVIASTTTGSPVMNIKLPVPKSSSVFARLGLRLSHNDTFLEYGYEQVLSRNVLKNYVFSPAGGDVVCSPDSRLDPYTCVLSDTPAATPVGLASDAVLFNTPLTPRFNLATYQNGGMYLNFNLKFPLWSRQDSAKADQSWYFILANKGDIYFNNASTDTTVQTRYLDKLTPSFQLPIYGRLSLTPKVDLILYENKVAHRVYRAAEPSFSLSYSFTVRRGLSTGKALRYGAIATSQSGGGAGN